MPSKDEVKEELFVAVKVADLQYKERRKHILSPDLVHEIVEDYARQHEAPPAAEPTPEPTPIPEAIPPAEPEPVAAEILPPEPAVPEITATPEETISQLANEILPSAADMLANKPPQEEPKLSQEEVEKLLNG